MSDRDKLKETVAEAMKDRATTWGGLTKWDELAEAALTAIEEAGYVVIPQAPSHGVLIGKTLHHLKDKDQSNE